MADEHHWRVDKKYLVKTKKEALELVAHRVHKSVTDGKGASIELIEITPQASYHHSVTLIFGPGRGEVVPHYALRPKPKWMVKNKKGEFVPERKVRK